MIQEKQGENITKRQDEVAAKTDKRLDYKRITKSEHQKILINSKLIETFRLSKRCMVDRSNLNVIIFVEHLNQNLVQIE